MNKKIKSVNKKLKSSAQRVGFSLLVMLIVITIITVSAETIEQQVTVTVLPGAIDVYSPVQDDVYTNRHVPINLSMSTEAYFKYADNGDRSRTLCRRCDEYGFSRRKTKPFDDGFHQLTIMAIFDSGTVYHYVNFTVDTKDPKIKKTEPRRGFADGFFTVEFQEENPVSLFLNYGNELRSAEVDLSQCTEPRRNRKKCQIEVDLEDFDGEEIEYWFNMTDIVGNIAESKKKKIDVDVSPPVINLFNYTIDRRRVSFLFNITEPNFDEIGYRYIYRGRERYKRLCSRLKNDMCVKRKSFRRGTYNLTIEVWDDAGNMAGQEINFTMDY